MTNSLSKPLPRVLVTMGEPAGIGPELLVRAAQKNFAGEIIALADADLLRSLAQRMKLPLDLKVVNWDTPAEEHKPGQLLVEPVTLPVPVETGLLAKENAQATLKMLTRAHQLASSEKVQAIVTGPVHKANLNSHDPSFLGHTEFFARAARSPQVVMMLASGTLRICLATTHIPLAKIPEAITQQGLASVIQTIIQSFHQLKLPQPRIAVCGLNPHAGEDGLLGREEIEVINPVIEALRLAGHQVSGAYPADTLFTPEKRSHFDVFLAMYHDQGLPVVKAFGFGQCANVTLGLPYIRTSVDHGTALDIAPKFSANADSLAYAINYALQLAAGKLPQ